MQELYLLKELGKENKKMKIYKVKVNGKVYEVELESVTEAQG